MEIRTPDSWIRDDRRRKWRRDLVPKLVALACVILLSLFGLELLIKAMGH